MELGDEGRVSQSTQSNDVSKPCLPSSQLLLPRGRLTGSPLAPNQLLQGVNAHRKGVVVLDIDRALPQVFAIDREWVARSRRQQQGDVQRRSRVLLGLFPQRILGRIRGNLCARLGLGGIHWGWFVVLGLRDRAGVVVRRRGGARRCRDGGVFATGCGVVRGGGITWLGLGLGRWRSRSYGFIRGFRCSWRGRGLCYGRLWLGVLRRSGRPRGLIIFGVLHPGLWVIVGRHD